jgi:hypothetical protein
MNIIFGLYKFHNNFLQFQLIEHNIAYKMKVYINSYAMNIIFGLYKFHNNFLQFQLIEHNIAYKMKVYINS